MIKNTIFASVITTKKQYNTMENSGTTHGSHLKSARYEHDCSACEYKGRYKKYDLYFCNGGDTLIARYGNEGWEYISKSAEELEYEMENEKQ